MASTPNTAVLRIIGGRLAGKEYPLGEGTRICVGHGLANDVVLRGAGTRDAGFELQLDGETAALRVLFGQVELLGRTLEPGQQAVLPSYLPFRFGEYVLAHGERASARWDDVASIAASNCVSPVMPLPAPRLSDRVVDLGRRGLVKVQGRVSGSRAALAAVSILLLAISVAPVRLAIEAQANAPSGLERRIESAGLGRLKVTSNPAGGMIVSGTVRNEADLMRLRALVGQWGTPVLVDVTSSAALASAATDVLQTRGIDANAEPAGLGAIAVRAPWLAADRRAEIEKLLRRDIPGLTRVAFRTDDSRGGDPLQSFFARGGTGLASVVEEPAHIVTADGARWFPGAVLPTGHRLVSVAKDSIRFEKDGRVEEIHP